MNTRQRNALIGTAILIIAAVLYPPFYFPYTEVGVNHGHDWLFGFGPGRIEGLVLMSEFIAIGMIGAIAYLVFGDNVR